MSNERLKTASYFMIFIDNQWQDGLPNGSHMSKQKVREFLKQFWESKQGILKVQLNDVMHSMLNHLF